MASMKGGSGSPGRPWRRWGLLAIAVLAAGCTANETDSATVSQVTFTKVPATAAPDSTFEICWRVDGFGTSQHTDLHLSNRSHDVDRENGASVEPHRGTSVFPDNAAQADPEGYHVPGEFCADVAMPSQGSLYVVAHAADSQANVLHVTPEAVISPQ